MTKESFEDVCAHVPALHDAKLSRAARTSIKQDLRLRHLYPGEHVAFTDYWRVRDHTRQLVRRVLVHSSHTKKVEAVLAELSPGQVKKVKVRYIEPLDVDICIPEDIGYR